ncbi:hypothetical protein Bca52824_020928 [Brassica carinata]|uniref:Uncharacterized protein n=1 Tax=Brassica carinata TaxID=52824 RepID=A0A8X7VU93_BRACI|nr:hypothetical protein Bca52824_020928 [Brassica carinata]
MDCYNREKLVCNSYRADYKQHNVGRQNRWLVSLNRCDSVCWALGCIVASLFFAVVEMSIDSIILSFCQDSEENQGNAQHAPSHLLETLDSNE